MTIREIAIAIGFDIDEAKLKNLAKNLDKIKSKKVSVRPKADTIDSSRQEAEKQITEEIGKQTDRAKELSEQKKKAAATAKEHLSTEAKIGDQEAKTQKEVKDQARQKKTIRTLLRSILGTSKQVTEESTQQTDEEKRKREEMEKTKAVYQQVSSMMRSSVGRLLGTLGLGFSLMQFKELTEEFNGINDGIRDATRGMGDQEAIQKRILTAANESRTAYGDTAKFVGNLVRENKELFSSVDDASRYAELTSKLFKAAGKSNDEVAALQEAINKSFAKGTVDSETISQLLEEAPEAVRLLEKELGVGKEQFEEMASKGQISLKSLRDSVLRNANEINRSFGELDLNLSDSLLSIRNEWGLWLDKINSTYGITKDLAHLLKEGSSKLLGWLEKGRAYLDSLAEKVGGMGNLLKLIAIIAGSLWLAFHASQILDFITKLKSGIKGLGALLSGANLKLLAIAAVIALIALLIDDFIHFMKGDNSLIGEMLESMGIDADEAREKIKAFGEKGIEIFKKVISWIAKLAKICKESFLIAKDTFWNFVEKFAEGANKIKKKLLELKNAFMNSPIGKIFSLMGKAGGALGGLIGTGVQMLTGSTENEVMGPTLDTSVGVHGRTNNVTQNISIENTFNGSDRQMQEKGADMMGAAATDSFEDASNALAWGR